MADRMAILIGGVIEQTGKPDELYNNPANRRVAEFLMLQNLFEGVIGEVDGAGLRVVRVGSIAFAVEDREDLKNGREVLLGIRPEEIILIRPDRLVEPVDRPNYFMAEVTGWVDLGHYRLVRLKVGGLELDCWLNIRAAREFPMRIGERTGFHIRPRSFCFLPREGG